MRAFRFATFLALPAFSAFLLFPLFQACSESPLQKPAALRATPKAAALRPEEIAWTVPGLSGAGNSFLVAWNRHDAPALAALWHEDGDLLDAAGRLARGRGEIEELLRDDLRTTRLNLVGALAPHFAGNDLRLEDWDVEIAGRAGTAGPLPPARLHFFLVYARQGSDARSDVPAASRTAPPASPPDDPGDRWKLASARFYAFQTPNGEVPPLVEGAEEEPPRVGGEISPPHALFTPKPVYTEVARRARVEGIVLIDALIDKKGCVLPRRVIKSLPLGLDAKAQEVVRTWKFKPAMRRGRPVEVVYTLSVPFQLSSLSLPASQR